MLLVVVVEEKRVEEDWGGCCCCCCLEGVDEGVEEEAVERLEGIVVFRGGEGEVGIDVVVVVVVGEDFLLLGLIIWRCLRWKLSREC